MSLMVFAKRQAQDNVVDRLPPLRFTRKRQTQTCPRQTKRPCRKLGYFAKAWETKVRVFETPQDGDPTQKWGLASISLKGPTKPGVLRKNWHPFMISYRPFKSLDVGQTFVVPSFDSLAPRMAVFFGQTPVFGRSPYGHDISVICVNHPYETHIFSTCC